MSVLPLPRRLLAEFVGTALLVTVVVGSGIAAAQLSPDDVARSGLRHILTNALGGSARSVHVDVDLLRLEDGDCLLLCSDGLTDAVDDDTIATTLASGAQTNQVCQRLVQLALDGGGRDNVTVIVAAFGF